MLDKAFTDWLRHAKRGETYRYYRGYLAADRGPDSPHERTDTQQAVSLLADTVAEARTKGIVSLVQTKQGLNNYSYYAIRR